ncbi:MAG: hypothetical protein ACK4NX_01800, partial [Candidatus Paceibacteria bacterium]
MLKYGEKMGREIKTIEEARKYVNYADWFTDIFAKDYLSDFPSRYERADASGKKAIANEANLVVLNYALIIYKIYPKSTKLKKAIDSNAQMKR